MLVLTFLISSSLFVVKPVSAASEDSWTSKAPMLTAREDLGVAVVDGRIYAIGGHNSSFSLVGANEMYDPASNTWITLTPMPTARADFGIAVYQNKIYVIGGIIDYVPMAGVDALAVGVVTGVNEVYDPVTNTWDSRKPMPTARGVLQANVVDGKIYLIGGFAQGLNFSNKTEVYDPSIDTWATMAPIPNYSNGFAAAAVDHKIYIIGNITQIFDPNTCYPATKP